MLSVWVSRMFFKNEGFIYLSNSILFISGYIYLQYHWWPVVLIVIIGWASSIEYSVFNDGIAINVKIIIGISVQIISIFWLSLKLLKYIDFFIVVININKMHVVINIINIIM